MDLSRHNTHLGDTRRDHARGIRADQPHSLDFQVVVYLKHVVGRNAFANANNYLDTGVRSFIDRIHCSRGRNVDDRRVCLGLFYCFGNGIEDRNALQTGATFAGSHPRDHGGAIFFHLPRME